MAAITTDAPITTSRPRRDRRSKALAAGLQRPGEGRWGWIFMAPAVIAIVVFLVLPIALALYVSFTNWNGQGGPFGDSAQRVGLENYNDLLLDDGLTRDNFTSALRNNFYFVLFVVPLQTVIAFALAMVLNQRTLRGKGAFRTIFYLPAVTSAIAIGLVFLFLFQRDGAINAVLGWFGMDPIQWVNNGTGIFHNLLSILGVDRPPGVLDDNTMLGMSLWDWLSGPSFSMTMIIVLATWTTSGTFMLMFLAGLQQIPNEVHEAAAVDGATRWQTLRKVTIPLMRRQIVLVVTLGLIGTWQVFDQIYVMSDGAGETVTPAYLAYTTGIRDGRFGRASALAFIVFLIILTFTAIQRIFLRDPEETGR
jgi:multiple sugar transport system permease protein